MVSKFSSLFYQAGSGVCLPKAKLLPYLLEGTAGSHVESIGDDDKDVTEWSYDGNSSGSILLNLPSCHFGIGRCWHPCVCMYILIMY